LYFPCTAEHNKTTNTRKHDLYQQPVNCYSNCLWIT